MKIYTVVTADNTEDLESQVNANFEDGWYLYGDLVVLKVEKAIFDDFSPTHLYPEFFQVMLKHKKG